MSLLVRSWNVFHGNAAPAAAQGLSSRDGRARDRRRPDVLCLQELPAWSLPRLDTWSGCTSDGAVARPPFWPAPFSAWLTRLHQGFFRSGLAGQANAILVRDDHACEDLGKERISTPGVERRVCQAVRVAGRLVVANLHATNDFRRPEVPHGRGGAGARIRRGARAPGRAGRARGGLQRHASLAARVLGAGRPGIDHVLVRGAPATSLAVWPAEQRPSPASLLSDHAPVEARGRMTFEEARALFPVLERTAYLNAGTFGPLARPTVEAMQAEQARDLAEGRGGKAWFDGSLELRERSCASELATLVGAEPEQVALTASTTDGCNIVLAGLGLGPEDEVVTTTDEHFGLLGPLHASGARVVVVPPDPDAILAAVTPRTRLLALSEVTWTTGGVLPLARAARARSAIPVLADGAQSVGGGAGRRGRHRLPHDLRAEVAVRAGCDGRARRRRPERLRVARPGYSRPGRVRARRLLHAPRPGRSASSRTGCPSAR